MGLLDACYRERIEDAATVLKHLEKHVGVTGSPVELGAGVTVEVTRLPVVTVDPYRRPADADTEILDTCEALTVYSGRPVSVITGDYGMRLRASAREISVIPMPEELRLSARSERASDADYPVDKAM